MNSFEVLNMKQKLERVEYYLRMECSWLHAVYLHNYTQGYLRSSLIFDIDSFLQIFDYVTFFRFLLRSRYESKRKFISGTFDIFYVIFS